MKKFLKLFLFISSFAFFAIRINAGVCDAHAIYTKDDLYDFDWAVPMGNICQLTKNAGNYDSGCTFGDAGSAKSSCEGAHQHPCTGEISYNTAGCSEESICNCFDCEYTCYYLEYYCSSHSCGCGTKPETNNCCCGSWRPTSWTEAELLGASGCLKDAGAGNTWLNNMMGKCKSYKSGSGAGQCIPKFKTRYPTYRCDASTGGRGSIDSIYDYEHYTRGDVTDYISAYCVNPDEAVPKSTNVYQIDATKCKNSYSTVDCGFANIMIEGNYRSKILGKSMYGDYAVILTALRLWAVHVGSAGFDLVGLGGVSEDQERAGDPNEWLRFVPNADGSFDNFYKLAYHNLMYTATYGDFRNNKIYEADTVNGFSDFRKISLSSAGIGVFSDGVNQPANLGKYLYAFQLFMNTVQGNDKMQDHLLALNLNASGISKEDLEIKEDEMSNYNDPVYSYTDLVGEKTIRVTYRLRENVEIDCSTLDEDTANDAGCQINQKVTIYDRSGNIVKEADAYDYCEKNVCFKEFTLDGYSGSVNCDAIDKIVVEVDSFEECGARSVKKYLDCANPRDSQMLVSFEADKNCDTKKPKKKKMTTFLQCDLCNEEPSFQDDSCVIKNGNVLNDNQKNVVVSTKDNHNGQKYVVNYAKDPSLNCILHKRAYESDTINQQGKAYYDYSEMFGINTNICKIYCSDSVNYYLPARESVNSSLQIKFDIHSRIFGDDALNKTPKALTSVIVVERNCVSKSFYDQPFDYNANWDIEYGLGNDQLLEHYQTFYRMSSSQAQSALNSIKSKCGEVTDFKSMFCRLNELAKKENSRKELLNSLVYDLYNCNMFTESDTISKSGGIIAKPKDADRNAIEYAKELISNTETYCNGDPLRGIEPHDCVTGGIKYEGGTQYFKDDYDEEDYEYLEHDDSGYTYVGLNGNVPTLLTDDKVSNNLGIKYCSDTVKANGTKEGCFTGSSSDENGNKEFVDRMEFATVDSKWETLSFLNSSVRVPSNDYTVFKFSVESQLYNSTKFYSEQFTGYVRNETSSNSSIYGSSDSSIPSKYLMLNDYVYPVSSDARKVCELNYHNIGIPNNDMTTSCDINYDFEIPIINKYNVEKNQLGYKIAFDRKLSVDGLSKSMLNSNEYTCVYDIYQLEENGQGFAYKNIDLDDPFPFYRTKTNWSSGLNSDCYDEEGKRKHCDYDFDEHGDWNPVPEKLYYKNYIGSVINEISNSGDNNLYATDEYLEYSYRLDANSIEAIREHNSVNSEGYFEVPYDCTNTSFGDGDNIVNYYSNCNSKFLDKLHNGDFDVQILKDDGISKYTMENNLLQNGGSR